MRINKVALLIAFWAVLTALAAVTACGGSSQFETIQTFEAEQKIVDTTATAEAVVAAGGDPDAGIQVGAGSIAAQAQATAAAKATAQVEGGTESGGSAVGSEAGSESEQEEGTEVAEIEVPDGPALEGEVTVNMTDSAFFEPEVIKVKVGTTVKWENPRGSPSSATSFEGEAEEWDTADLWKSSFNPEVCCGTHTFTIVGCHRYRSEFSGDTATGAVCVVE